MLAFQLRHRWVNTSLDFDTSNCVNTGFKLNPGLVNLCCWKRPLVFSHTVNVFFITIRIPWTIYFTIIPFLVRISQQISAEAETTQLSWMILTKWDNQTLFPWTQIALIFQWCHVSVVLSQIIDDPIVCSRACSLQQRNHKRFTSVPLCGGNTLLSDGFPCHGVTITCVVSILWIIAFGQKIYRKTSSISRTKSQNLNISCLLLQWSLHDPLKPGVKLRMKM